MATLTIGKMNRRPTFQNTLPVQDSGGGSTDEVQEEWKSWCEIIDTSGSTFISQGTELVRSDFKVTARFDGRFKSTTRMVYEGQICQQQGSPNITSEGYKQFLVMRFNQTDTWVNVS